MKYFALIFFLIFLVANRSCDSQGLFIKINENQYQIIIDDKPIKEDK